MGTTAATISRRYAKCVKNIQHPGPAPQTAGVDRAWKPLGLIPIAMRAGEKPLQPSTRRLQLPLPLPSGPILTSPRESCRSQLVKVRAPRRCKQKVCKRPLPGTTEQQNNSKNPYTHTAPDDLSSVLL